VDNRPTGGAAMARRDGQTRKAGVRSLERGLALLIAMNRRKLPSVVELARDTRLPRPTVYRLLETLNRAGFVTRSSPADRFCLTPKVRSLSDGFLEDDWIADVAAPLMAQFTRDLVWPAALMTFEQGRMLVRETTHEASVLSIDHGMVGRSLPMLRTAAGRCYLACCSTSERRAILKMLAHSPAAEDQGAREKERVGALLDAIRAKGFAIQDREINPKATGMAIPIRAGARILGCLSLIWISSALTIAEAEQRLLPPLRSVAERIEQAVGARSVGRSGYAA
jgi:IclR family transcriptional regulator, mhp operon transcriptional activator